MFKNKKINLKNLTNKLCDLSIFINFEKINFDNFYFNFKLENDKYFFEKRIRINNLNNYNYNQLLKKLSFFKSEFKKMSKFKNNKNNWFDNFYQY